MSKSSFLSAGRLCGRPVPVILMLAAATWAQETRPAPAHPADKTGGTSVKMTVQSTAFEPGMTVPKKYTGEGQDISPPLAWSGVPKETKELALICDDPDAPRPEPWVHWVIYGMPPNVTGLPEGVPKEPRVQSPPALQGKNTSNQLGYNGPMPPPGHGVHHYHFKLYALDSELKLAPGLTKDQLLRQIKPHVIAESELVGTYQR
jgi:Raf kinase inhibitor-like YbhB/YbcL family protein